MTPPQRSVTQWLVAWSEGDQTALDQLIPLVHDELRRLAHRYLRQERARARGDVMLQTSGLINDAYLRLVDAGNVRWQNRAHFFAISAQLMRRILVDYARARQSEKRGGRAERISLSDAAILGAARAPDLVALDDALSALAGVDERKSRVVELRFFGGLSVKETAEVLKISSDTVQRDWRLAKAWLFRELSMEGHDEV